MNSCGFNSFRIWPLVTLLSLAWLGTSDCLNYRLGTSVVPSFYNLTISLRDVASHLPPAAEFDGDVEITLQAVQADVFQITLHKDKIEITSCSLYSGTGALVENIANTRMTYEQETQQLTLPLTQALAVNQSYKLHFNYTGRIQTDMAGLFSTKYMDLATITHRRLLFTQMQAINARLVLPCFDEPIFKAKFQVHIGRPSGLSAISNTKLLKTVDEGNNRFMDHFEVTPVMSTYLLAFVISEYTARGNSSLAIYTRPAYYSNTSFSYSVAERVLPAFGELFQQPYQDLGNEVLQYATTPDFPHNSMENWGLVIFKDKVVLEDPGFTDGWIHKEFTIRNIAHENALMWFGNSVTIKWWGFLWLNEGFARYYEYFMGNELYPEYQLDQQFVVHKLQPILSSDSLNIVDPLTIGESKVTTPADIDKMLGSNSFDKAASIIRMWRNLMGNENFYRAIRNYLKQYHLSNSSPKDLHAHFKENWPQGDSVNVDQLFYDYTGQMGYPVIVVSLDSDGQLVSMSQQPFLLNPGDGSNAKLRYTVPITFTTDQFRNFQNLTPVFYMDKIVGTYQRRFEKPINWIILNKKQSNYHRVLYEAPLLGRIQKSLTEKNHGEIPVENRAALIDDLFNFARAEMIDYVEVFEFMEYMSTETDYIPWYAAYEGLTLVAKRLTPQQLPNFNKYLSDITAAVYEKLGVNWSPSDKVLDVYNRNKQVAWLCKYQSKECNDQVKQLFEEKTEKPTPDYRETFYCAASRSGGYDRVLELYYKETNFVDREPLLRAASCTRDYRTHYQNEVIGLNNSGSFKLIALAQLYEQNLDLVTPIFQMVIEDIFQLKDTLGTWSETAQALSDIADYFTTREQLELFSNFYKENHLQFGSSADILSKALVTVETNLQWADKRLGRLVTFLAQRNGAAGLAMATTMLVMISAILNLWLK